MKELILFCLFFAGVVLAALLICRDDRKKVDMDAFLDQNYGLTKEKATQARANLLELVTFCADSPVDRETIEASISALDFLEDHVLH